MLCVLLVCHFSLAFSLFYFGVFVSRMPPHSVPLVTMLDLSWILAFSLVSQTGPARFLCAPYVLLKLDRDREILTANTIMMCILELSVNVECFTSIRIHCLVPEGAKLIYDMTQHDTYSILG